MERPRPVPSPVGLVVKNGWNGLFLTSAGQGAIWTGPGGPPAGFRHASHTSSLSAHRETVSLGNRYSMSERLGEPASYPLIFWVLAAALHPPTGGCLASSATSAPTPPAHCRHLGPLGWSLG